MRDPGPGADVTVDLHGAALARTSAGGDGRWSIETEEFLVDGEHTLEVEVRDNVSNIARTTAPHRLTIDTVAADTSMGSGPADGATISLPVTVTLESSEDDAEYECQVDSATWTRCSSPHTLSDMAPGMHAFRVRSVDAAGNADDSPVVRSYRVSYSFAGLFPPLDNLPTMNLVKAGSAVPVKFSLEKPYGLDVLADRSPSVRQIACSATSRIDEIEETLAASSSGLTYDQVTGMYVYEWKTEKSWVGSCRELTLRLRDGSEHRVVLKLR